MKRVYTKGMTHLFENGWMQCFYVRGKAHIESEGQYGGVGRCDGEEKKIRIEVLGYRVLCLSLVQKRKLV